MRSLLFSSRSLHRTQPSVPLCGLAALCVLAVTLVSPAAAEEQLVEGIAAQVGNEIVLASEVLEMSASVEERMRQAGAPPSEILKMRRDALERLIDNKLLSSVVERLELTADREEIDGAIEAIAAENGLSLEQLLTSVTSHGLSVDEYRAKIKGEIERGKVVNAMVRSRVSLDEEEVVALFEERFGDQPEGGEEVYVKHLVVMPEGRSARTADDACALVREARARIEGGSIDFATAAREISDTNVERGGDMGWLHSKDLAGWMSGPLARLQPGQLSEPISMPFGCNLLQLVDRRTFTPITYEQAAPQLQQYLIGQKTEAQYVEWMEVLRKQTYIDRKGAFGG
ncbi:MAG: peptidylprolyl isomerase [Myxococcota bacterium]